MNYIYSYVRDEKRNKRGIVVALDYQGEIRIGYSLLHKNDKWNKDLGINIALSRAMLGKTIVPERTRQRIEFIINSASRRKIFEGIPVPSINSFKFVGPPKGDKNKNFLKMIKKGLVEIQEEKNIPTLGDLLSESVTEN